MDRMQERTSREERESAVTCWECGGISDDLVQAPWTGKMLLVCGECLNPEEPECTCTQTDVDMFDPRGCEYHDSSSPWNVRLRAVTSVQRYESEREVA